jgi:fermentation-respiration switch protein FrsA (DUF1100 family)
MSAGGSSKRTARRILVAAPLVLVAIYAAVLLYFHRNEDRLIFHPTPGPPLPSAAALALDSRDVTLPGDGVQLVARLIPPPPDIPGAAAGWLLYLHGNGGNIGDPGYNAAWARFRRLGLGVLAVDYRGYGASTGVPSEAGLYRDAADAYAYLTGQLHVPPARILIYGYSLGSAVAIDLATRVPAAGLMVEGGFLSITALGAERYPFLPVAWLAHNRFASVDKIAAVAMPKLLIHARADEVVPFAHGQRLFVLASPPKWFQPVGGGHITAHDVDPAFFAAIRRFVTHLGLPVTSP